MNPKIIILPLRNKSRMDAKAVAEKLLAVMKAMEEKEVISASERRHSSSILSAARDVGIRN